MRLKAVEIDFCYISLKECRFVMQSLQNQIKSHLPDFSLHFVQGKYNLCCAKTHPRIGNNIFIYKFLLKR